MAFFRQHIAIDLGSANTLISVSGQGVTYCEPTVVAVDVKKHEVCAVGESAHELLGKTPGSVLAKRPVSRGAIMDYELTASLLKAAIRRAVDSPSFFRPSISAVLCVSAGISDMDRRAFEDVAAASGIRDIMFIETPLASGRGMGLDIEQAKGRLICNLGAGKSDFAVVSLSGIVHSGTLKLGGQDMDAALAAQIKDEHGLIISERAAEVLKISLAHADGAHSEEFMAVRGRDIDTCLPREITVGADEVSACLAPLVNKIAEALRDVLLSTPPELMYDILSSGIYLCGGASQLTGMAGALTTATGLSVTQSDSPQSCTVAGAGQLYDSVRMIHTA